MIFENAYKSIIGFGLINELIGTFVYSNYNNFKSNNSITCYCFNV